MRRSGFVLAGIGWLAFGASFFLPTACVTGNEYRTGWEIMQIGFLYLFVNPALGLFLFVPFGFACLGNLAMVLSPLCFTSPPNDWKRRAMPFVLLGLTPFNLLSGLAISVLGLTGHGLGYWLWLGSHPCVAGGFLLRRPAEG